MYYIVVLTQCSSQWSSPPPTPIYFYWIVVVINFLYSHILSFYFLRVFIINQPDHTLLTMAFQNTFNMV